MNPFIIYDCKFEKLRTRDNRVCSFRFYSGKNFPLFLFQGSTNVDELIKLVNEHFNATFPESEVTQRLLDEFEISEIREEYCIKQENEVPKRERETVGSH